MSSPCRYLAFRVTPLRVGGLMGALVTALLAALLAVYPAHAGERGDHERARAALKAGEVLPLHRVLEQVRREHPGDVLEVELERESGRWVYELKLLQPNGALLQLDVDARSGEVIERRERARSRREAGRPNAPASRATP